MSEKEQRIRELAYQIWQSEGCPEGQEARHWEMAAKLADAEEGAPAAAKPAARARRTATKPTDATPAVAKPKATRTTRSKAAPATPAAPEGDTNVEAGTPQTIKKTRTTKAKKDS